MKKTLPWTRYWVPQGVEPDIRGDFLLDREAFAGQLNADLVATSELNRQCLVLLGEAGIGKSTELSRLREQEEATPVGSEVLFLSLQNLGSESRLNEKLWQSAQVCQWEAGASLVLYLDGFDECSINITTLASWLAEELRSRIKLIPNLRVRVCCRSSYWPSVIDRELREIFASGFGQYQLAPLTVDNVVKACEAENVDNQAFLQAVVEKSISSFAARPIGLEALLKQYVDEEGTLPGTRWELYETLCTRFVQEPKERSFQLEPDERLRWAEELALLSLLSGRLQFAVQDLVGRASDSILTPTMVRAGRKEPGSVAMKDTLSTALFSPGDGETVTWSHRTYAEFLAARRLKANDLNGEALLALFRHQADRQHIVPQLAGVASWLAPFRPELLAALLRSNPRALFDGAPECLCESQRLDATHALLAYAEGEECGYDLLSGSRYESIATPALLPVLNDFLRNSTLQPGTRRLALRLFACCALPEHPELLLELVVDKLVDEQTRRSAISEFVIPARILGKHHEIREMTQILDEDNIPLPLLTDALLALFPRYIDAERLFSALPITAEDWKPVSGLLFSILHEKSLETADLPHAISWLQRLSAGQATPSKLEGVVQQLLVMALTHVESVDLGVLADVMVPRLLRRGGRRLVEQQLLPEDRRWVLFPGPEQRQDFALHLVGGLGRLVDIEGSESLQTWARDLAPTFVWSEPAVLVLDDLDWVLNQVESIGELEREVWSWVVRLLTVTPDVTDEHPAFIKAQERARQIPLLGERAPWLITGKSKPEETEEFQQEVPDSIVPIERQLVALLESDELVGIRWARVLATLQDPQRPERFALHDLGRPAPEETSSWLELSEPSQAKVIELGIEFISTNKAPPLAERGAMSDWGHLAYISATMRLADGGLVAAQLEERELSSWCPQLLRAMASHSVDDRSAQLLDILYESCREQVLGTLDVLLRRDDPAAHLLLRRELMQRFSEDEEFLQLLDRTLKAHTVSGDLLDDVVRIPFFTARQDNEVLRSYLKDEPTDDCVRIASRLVLHEGQIGWDTVGLTDRGDDFVKQVLNRMAELWFYEGTYYRDKCGFTLPDGLDDETWASLLGHLWTLFPNADHNSDHHVWSFQNDLWRRFREFRPTRRDTILRLMKARVPQPERVERIQRSQYQQVLQDRWEPMTPRQVLGILEDSERRAVRSGSELRALIVGILRNEIQDLLVLRQGESPLLWNRTGAKKKGFTVEPKGEVVLSDYVANRLREQLISRVVAVHREVEVTRQNTAGQGDRTDILVTCPIDGQAKAQAEVVIEVKCNWNKDLLTNMRSQLVEQYLANQRKAEGIYLVGWFWGAASTSAKLKKATRFPQPSTNQKLQEQMEALRREGWTVEVVFLNIPEDPKVDGKSPPM